ncbi:MAG: molybdopterin molybdotransferase MoeA [Alphaproteobacteria bacterium]|nr:molybdopterin molybdotransferase MoeA [Alphaproteobacteria bacterium]
MSKLADDCFNQVEDLMSTAEALAVLRQRIVAVTQDRLERLPLAQAQGRILAEDLVSNLDVPPHDNSAVDGYALRHGDLKPDAPSRLAVAGRSAAGHPFTGHVEAGGTVRIFTGAVMPDGADTVVMQEDVERSGEHIVIPPGLKSGANRRRQGEDTEKGDVVLARGRRLRAQDLGLAASVGHGELTLYRPLKVGVFSTGDELVEPGADLPTGGIYDANRQILMALVGGLGAQVSDLGILPDEAAAVRQGLSDAAEAHDLLLTSGGVSVGDEDHVRGAVEALGHLHFWRLAIKPGRPLALGQVGATAFVGLPGNPVAATVCFLRFARPLILGLAGAVDLEPALYRVTADFDYEKKAGRREWLRARLEHQVDAGPRAVLFRPMGSGIINSLVQTHGLVEIAEDVTRIKAGEAVDFLPFDEVAS